MKFRCTSGECIFLAYRCNTIAECEDGSDETPAACAATPPTQQPPLPPAPVEANKVAGLVHTTVQGASARAPPPPVNIDMTVYMHPVMVVMVCSSRQ